MVTSDLYPGATQTTLSNGLRILIEEVPQSRSASIGIWVKVGSRDDPPEQPGLAHFVEHLAFKGTATRTSLALSKEIDAVGGYLNAATGKESTFYYADVPADGLSTAVDVLFDLVLHPAFDPPKIDLERAVVLEEIRGHEDDPESVAFDRFMASVWKGKHPLSRSVLGTRESILSLRRKHAVSFHALAYRPQNMVIVATGAVDANRLLEETLRHVPAADEPATASPPRQAPVLQPGRMHFDGSSAQTHIYVGLPGPVGDAQDRFPLEIANTILGDGTSSRLFCSIREDRGLAYAVGSTVSRYTDAGLWLAYAGVAPETVAQTASLILDEVARLRNDPIPSDEIALAKSRLRGSFILSLESNANRAMRLGTAAIADREIRSPDAVLAELEEVTPETVHEAVRHYDREDQLNLTTIGPTEPPVL